ncbi:conserved hypothetical protein [Beggiatoa sp. PS]|nr:conserved hypothetical protein [Beggiatoa sp. PS]
MRKKIFVDTWAWYALADKNDADHALAEKTNKQLLDEGYLFVTTNNILSESVTLIRYKLNHTIALKFWNLIQSLVKSGILEVVRVNEWHEQKAWEIFEKYHDQEFSLVDCTSFAVMQDLGSSEVFTGDHHFSIMGFIRVP